MNFRVCPIIGRPHPFSRGEQLLAKRLANDAMLSGLFQFNIRVTTKHENQYLVDLVWIEGKVVVEVDGYEFHSDRHAFSLDRRRDYELTVSGYLVLGCRTTRSSRTPSWRSRRSGTWCSIPTVRMHPDERDSAMSIELKPIEILFLWRLAVAGGGDWKKEIKPDLESPARKRLESAGLIEAEKRKSPSGRGTPLFISLTDERVGLAGRKPRLRPQHNVVGWQRGPAAVARPAQDLHR